VPGQLLGRGNYRSEYIDGHDWKHHHMVAAATLRFAASVGDLVLTPPDKYVHNFASIPRWVWPIIGPPSGDGPGAAYGPAAILHDWAGEHQEWDNGEPLSRRTADAILWEACFDLHVAEWRQELMYAAVRIGGGRHYRRHARAVTSDYTVE